MYYFSGFLFSSKNSFISSRNKIICRAVSSGILPTAEDLKAVLAAVPMSDVVKGFYDKMEPFKGNLKDVSNKSDPNYTANVEDNSKLVIEYAKDMYKKVYTGIPTTTVDAMFDATKIGGTTSPNTNALPKLASLLSKSHTFGFWDAVNSRVQTKRDLAQQVDNNVGMTVEEFKEAQNALRNISAGYAFNAKTTNSLTYIKGMSPQQKLEDAQAFSIWVKDNSNHYADIIRLSLSDLPFSFAAVELIAFENDQKSAAKKTAVINKLNELKKQALIHVRSELKKNASAKVDIQAWLRTK